MSIKSIIIAATQIFNYFIIHHKPKLYLYQVDGQNIKNKGDAKNEENYIGNTKNLYDYRSLDSAAYLMLFL